MNNSQEHIDDFMYRTFGYRPLRKAPTESGLPPEQHDALMRRFFPNEAPASSSSPAAPAAPAAPASSSSPEAPAAPAASRLSSQQEARLNQMAHFMAGTPGATRPSPLPSDESLYSGPYGTYTGEGARQQRPRTDLRAEADNLGTNEQPEPHVALSQWENHRHAVNRLKELQELREKHIAAGKLTNGSDYYNIGQAEHGRIKAVLAAYDKWKKTGGPKPDLSHLDEIVIHKNGKPWDHKAVIDGMYEDSRVDAAPSAAELFDGRADIDRMTAGRGREEFNISDLYDRPVSYDVEHENPLRRGIGTANHFLALGTQHRRMSQLDPRTASRAIRRHLRAMDDLEMHPAVTEHAERLRGVRDRGMR